MPRRFTLALSFMTAVVGGAWNAACTIDARDHLVANRESHTGRDTSETAYTLSNPCNEYSQIDGQPVVYDEAGNLVQDEEGRQYSYDEHNRLVEIRAADDAPLSAYGYDALGRRVGFVDWVADYGVYYTYAGHSVIEEYVDSFESYTRVHVNGEQYIDEHVATFNQPGSARYYLLNDLYTVVGVGDEDGNIVSASEYDAYGPSDISIGTSCEPGDLDGDLVVDLADAALFTGVLLTGQGDPEELCAADLNRDGAADGDDVQPFLDCLLGGDCPPPVTGDRSDGTRFGLHGAILDVLSDGLMLQYNRARYYDVRHGRWLQRDPSGYVDGNNLYESFGSNPTRFVDPFGDDDLDPTRYGFFGASPEEVRRGMQASQAGWWAVQQGATFDQAQSIAAEALNPPLPLFQEEFRREFAIGFGVIGTAGGVLEIAGGVTLFVPSLGFTTVFIAHGADVTQASARQVWTGEFTPTFTYTWIAEAGYPTTAMIVDMGLSISSGFSGPATSWLRVAGRTGMGVFRGETTAAARAPFFVRMDRAIRRLPMRLLPRMESGSVSLGTNFSLGPVSGAGRIKPLTGAQLPLSFPDPPGGALSLRIAPTTTRAGAAASPMTGSQWYEALSARYGAENVTWSRLPAYTGGKTSGVLATSIGDIDLISGYVGPSAAMGNGAIPGMNNVLRAHVEGHAASAMSQLGINDATRPTG